MATGAVGTNTDFNGDGGLIYGTTDNIAVEMDAPHAGFGSTDGPDFDINNASLGVQYRFSNLPIKLLAPHVGRGLDTLRHRECR
jgi:outer membrane protein